MACCAVKGCLNNRKFPPKEKNISFHVFPRDDLQKEWLTLIGRSDENWIWSKNRVICSEHFKEDDIIMSAGKRSLKCNAVPTLKLRKVKIEPSSISSSYSFVSSTSTIEPELEASATSQNVLTGSTSGKKCSKQSLIQFIKTIHSYNTTPTIMKKRYINLRKGQLTYRRKLYEANKIINSLKKEVLNLKEEIFNKNLIIENLKKNKSVSECTTDHFVIINSL